MGEHSEPLAGIWYEKEERLIRVDPSGGRERQRWRQGLEINLGRFAVKGNGEMGL